MAEKGIPAPPQQEEPHIGPARAGLRIGCLNACGMLQQVDGMREGTARIRTLIYSGDDDTYFDVFAVVETGLKSIYPKADHERIKRRGGLKIDGYSYLNYPCQLGTQGHGGILIYIRNSVKFTDTRAYEEITSDNNERSIQLVVVRITKPFELNLVAVYNPDEDRALILNELLRSCLNSLETDVENIVVLGDFNIGLRYNREIVFQLHEHMKSPETMQSSTHVYHICSSQDRIVRFIDCNARYQVIRKLCVAEADFIQVVNINHYPIFCTLVEKLICKPCGETFANDLTLEEHLRICVLAQRAVIYV